jgi:hypothetical protein
MKRLRITLTGVEDVLKEETLNRLDNSEKFSADSELRCSLGHTLEFYENLAVKPPEDLLQKIKDREESELKAFSLEENDWEESVSEIVVFVDQIRFIVTDEVGTVVYLKDNTSLSVKETAYEIEDYLEFIQRPLLQKAIDYIKEKLITK